MSTGRHRGWPASLVAVLLWLAPAAPAVTIEEYLAAVQAYHPVFTSETLRYGVEFKKQEAIQGGEDWSLSAAPAYDYDEPLKNRFAAAEEVDNLHFSAAMARPIWKTGGRLQLAYDYNYNDSKIAPVFLPFESGEPVDITGPSEFFDNAVALTYTHPLRRNAGGALDSLEADLQGYTARQSIYTAYENLEAFLRSAALLYIDWAQLHEQRRIAAERLHLAEEELADTRKKLDLNIVEKVDLHRAENAVWVAQQGLKQVEQAWHATQVELAMLSGKKEAPYQAPDLELYKTVDLPDADAAVQELRRSARVLRKIDVRLAQITREQEGLQSAGRANLDVILSGGLKDGADSFTDSTGFSQPNVGVALAYQHPLGNRTARAEIERAELERMRTVKIREEMEIQLESSARSLLIRISDWMPVLALNRERIKTAADKTREEARLYEQGRNELTFVIQSRDAEARAKLSYADNAATYHRLVIQFRALMDELFVPAQAK
ncbi:MAG: TolC family protein [Verrucomicrobia bacterium]|nr:TolC family protein [Verrucomicrobiota bacterium]MDA1087491.1 TolC family protein [Verrucomicrobiota bacterium]